MTTTRSSESDSDDYRSHTRNGGSASTASHDDRSSVTDMDAIFDPPVHPVSSMQAAFEESIRESAAGEAILDVEQDAAARRQSLLDASEYDGAWRSRWQQSPAAQHHPLWKLIAQIVFGMHLLQQEQAKSNEEVVSILQTHVNEIDGFLERTADDFNLAITDIEERIEHLRLPMAHPDVFRHMLKDVKFRTSLLVGNQKIDGIIDRTFSAMNATLLDIQRGLDSSRELAKYLDLVSPVWPNDRPDIAEVFTAMRGNEQGWTHYLGELQRKSGRLRALLSGLRATITEMARLASLAEQQERNTEQSRMMLVIPTEKSSSPLSPGLRSRFSPELLDAESASLPSAHQDYNKPLPTAPERKGRKAENVLDGANAKPRSDRKDGDSCNDQVVKDAEQAIRSSKPSKLDYAESRPSVRRPQTAGNASAAKRNSSAELANFLRSAGPLRSNPPELSFDVPRTKKPIGIAKDPWLDGTSSLRSRRPEDMTQVRMVLQQSRTMDFLNSPPETSTHARSEGRALSIRSASGIKREGQAFARRISARMRGHTYNEDDRPSPQKYSGPIIISSPTNFRPADPDDDTILLRSEQSDHVSPQMPVFNKNSSVSARAQSLRAPSITSVGRTKLRNMFQRGWRPKDPEIIG